MPSQAQLSADRPLRDPADDRLGYALFAEHLAATISDAPDEGLVVGLHGGSGSGKTTAANFARHHLRADGGAAIAEFAPWSYGVKGDLAAGLAAAIARAAGLEAPDGGDPGELRAGLADALRDRPGRVVVIVDDLDRLEPPRLADAIRVLESVGRIPGVVQLLVFDRRRHDPITVDRLVQVPFDLPLPEQGALAQMFLDGLRDLLERNPATAVVTEHHWQQIFSPGIETLLATPRDVVRLLNTLRVTYPPLAAEVNTADFIAIEAIRVFRPALHDTIRRTPGRFAGSSRPRTAAAADAESKLFHGAWIDQLDPASRISLITLILRLFPAVPDVEGLIIARDPPGEDIRPELRVASPELFSTYFRFTVPATVIAKSEMAELVAQGTSPASFAAVLRQLAGERDPSGNSRIVTFVDQLGASAPSLDPARVEPVVGAVIEVGDEFGSELDDRFDRLLDRLLDRVPTDQRADLLERQFRERAGVGLIVAEVARFGREHGRHGGPPERPEDQRTVSLDDVARLEQVALARIRERVAAGSLAAVPRLAVVLGRWRVWDRAACLGWVSDAVADDPSLIALVMAFPDNPEAMRPLVAPEHIVHRVRALAAEGTAEPPQRAALERFVAAYAPEDAAIEDAS
ncbi:MAG TPA: P-loop NTPase fold protein [Gaiellales bacterium]|nr:P-loop NTPase fold protein [Gaiellales bacterium]